MKTNAQSNQHGHTVIFTLVACLVLGIVLLGIIKLANTEGQMTGRSQNWNNAMPIVEAGIEEALTHLRHSPSNRSANGWSYDTDSNPPRFVRTRTFKDGFYRVAISTNYDPVITSRAGVRAPGDSEYTIFRTVRVRATNQPMFTAALEAPISVILKGNGTKVDSYDSLDPKYSLPNGGYNPAAPKDGGDVVSYGGAGSLDIGNGDINGKIKTGPETTYSVGANGSVGSLTYTGSGVQSGWVEEAPETDYPPITAPSGGVTPPRGQGATSGYQWVLPAGVTYVVNDISGSVLVTGSNAVLVVNKTLSMAPKDTILIQAGASLTMFVRAADVKLAGIANQNTDALKFQYYGLPENVSISMGGNAAFTGVLYAPNAILNLNGGGSDAVDFCGAIIAKEVKVNGHYNFHYDEATRRFGSRGIIAASWDELSPDAIP